MPRLIFPLQKLSWWWRRTASRMQTSVSRMMESDQLEVSGFAFLKDVNGYLRMDRCVYRRYEEENLKTEWIAHLQRGSVGRFTRYVTNIIVALTCKRV